MNAEPVTISELNMLATGAPEMSEDGSRTTKRKAVTYYVNEALAGDVRNAAIYLGGHPAYLTLSDIVEAALEAELARLEEKFNGGEAFPTVPGRLKTGRPSAQLGGSDLRKPR